jgi:threonine synthase
VAEIAAASSTVQHTIDPHTAVGLYAARSLAVPGRATITLATADPAKFPEAVEKATGRRPHLPPHLAELFQRPEHFEVVANDLDEVADHIRLVSP